MTRAGVVLPLLLVGLVGGFAAVRGNAWPGGHGGASEGASDETSGIRVERASLVRLPTQLALDARAEIELPGAVRAGLDNGVPLDFVVSLAVHRPRSWWPDRRRLDARWHFRLEYYELTRHYRLSALDSGRSRNFRSLQQALDALGTLRGLPVAVGPPLVRAGDLVRVGMSFDTGALPLPLQPLTSSSWRVTDRPLAWREPS